MTTRPPPPPVGTRDELIYLLSMAAELEHGLSCLYMFAAFSLKDDLAEGGLTEAQVPLVQQWKRTLFSVAVGEMMHLAQVSNLLTAIGGAPHLRRPNFPQRPGAYPFGIAFTLQPFSHATLQRLVCFELPEDLPPAARAVFDPLRAAVLRDQGEAATRASLTSAADAGIEPHAVEFATVGELYRTIEAGFRALPEAALFLGPRAAQAAGDPRDFRRDLLPVVDRASAAAAIDRIIKEGEGAPSERPDAHFTVFNQILAQYDRELAQSRARGAEFAPARPVVPDPVTRRHQDSRGGAVIADPFTHAVAELFNLAYETMLLMLLRFFACAGETDDELDALARAALTMMTAVLRPLGEALTRLPFGGAGHPGQTAGPGFGFTREVHLLPHRHAAWVVVRERLERLAATGRSLGAHPGAPVALARAAEALAKLAADFRPR